MTQDKSPLDEIEEAIECAAEFLSVNAEIRGMPVGEGRHGDSKHDTESDGTLEAIEECRKALAHIKKLREELKELGNNYADYVWYKHGDGLSKYYESDAHLRELNEDKAKLLNNFVNGESE